MVKGKKIVCLCTAFALAAGGVVGCTHKGTDDRDQSAKTQSTHKQDDGDRTDDTESIAEKYREKESQQMKKSRWDNGVNSLFGCESDSVMYAEEYCDEVNIIGETASVGDTSNDMYSEIAYDTREYDSMTENGFVSTADRPLSTFAADRDTASYSNIRSYIESGCLPPEGAVRIEEMLNYFTYDYRKKPDCGEKFAIYTEYSDCPWNKDTKLMMVGINTDEIDFNDKKPSNLVFLIDTSGSMYDDNKLPLVQQSFAMLAENLDENDRVSIVTYAGEDTVVLSGTSGSEQYTISEALSNMTAEGCTNGGDAIITAYELAEKNFIDGGNNRVILATDGDLNVGLTSESDLVDLITEEKKKNNIFLSVLGFGTDNLKDNKLEALADNGDGSYAFIDSAYEAKKVLVDEMGGTLNTVAKDVKFQIEFNPTNVKGYRQIGYENRALADADFANDAVDGGEIGAGHMVTALYEIVSADSDFEVPSAERKYGEKSGQVDMLGAVSHTSTDNGDGAEDYSGELATINIRYKEPDGDKSSLESYVVNTDSYSSEMSADMSAASAVAAYGMILKDSEYKGDADLNMVTTQLESKLKEIKTMPYGRGKAENKGIGVDITAKQWQDFENLVERTRKLFS